MLARRRPAHYPGAGHADCLSRGERFLVFSLRQVLFVLGAATISGLHFLMMALL